MSALVSGRVGQLRLAAGRHAVLLVNAGAMAAGTLATAVLGFVYWWLAARSFTPQAVGFAAAAISLMNLVAHLGEVGLGPYLMGELGRRPRAASLVSAALVAALAASAGLALLSLLVARLLGVDLGAVAGGPGAEALFVAGCALTALTLVLDQAFIGLLRGGLQLSRNVVFAAVKLLLLAALALAAGQGADEAELYATWVLGQGASIALVAGLLAWSGQEVLHRPALPLLRPVLGQVAGHHALSVAIQAPGLLLPFVVATTLSAEVNAAFYCAWTLLNVVLLVPASLSAVMVAVGVRDPGLVAARLRLSLLLSTLAGMGAGLAFLAFSPEILGLFSPAYPGIAGTSLAYLGFGALGLMVKYHYLAIQRLRGRLGPASAVLAAGAMAELAAAILGGRAGTLLDLTQAWLVAVLAQGLLLAPPVLAAARRGVVAATPAAAPSFEQPEPASRQAGPALS